MLASDPGFMRGKHLWLMVLILLLAAALRLTALGEVPPGLYHDEAYNGLDALKVLDGDLSMYFAANNGREPMFIYLIALCVGFLGRSPIAVRLAAFAPGLLTVAASYALGKTVFSRRVGLLSAAILGVTLWHIHLSRVGFRAVLLPLFIALALWQGALGWRTGRKIYWIAAGALYGLSFYTYTAARFTPLAIVLFGSYLLLSRRELRNRQRLAPLVWSGLAMLVALAPLALFTILHPDLVLSRTGQVSILNPDIHSGDFWGTLARHTTRALGMFFAGGDRIWRHNVPWRPVFDPLLGGLFLAGLIVALRRFYTDAKMAFLIIWTATMLLPTLLAEDAPHFLRSVGVLPLATAFPALGIDRLLQSLNPGRRILQLVAYLFPMAVLSTGFASSVSAYFGDYARAETTAYWFEDGAEALAGEINRFLGSGWDGERMLHRTSGEASHSPDRQAYIEPALRNTWPALSFLIVESSAIQLLPSDREWPAITNGKAAIFLWPYGNWRRVWSMLSLPGEIRAKAGALSQGDRDPEPYITYSAFYFTPVETVPPPLARFQGGVELVAAQVRSTDQGVRVELGWHATARLTDDYTVFVHYMRGEERVAQDDAQPAGGHYPTSQWQIGDLIFDEHLIPLVEPPDSSHDQVILGLYRHEDGQHLNRLDQTGNPVGTFLALPVNAIEVP
jgi:4-amino-4-deoxy-L-arabinose transferase-like glycosyltransferase